MKKLLCLLAATVLVGCSDYNPVPVGYTTEGGEVTGIPDLQGCKVYAISPDNSSNIYNRLYVVKCPDGKMTTEYQTDGKGSHPVSVSVKHPLPTLTD